MFATDNINTVIQMNFLSYRQNIKRKSCQHSIEKLFKSDTFYNSTKNSMVARKIFYRI